MRTAAQSCKEEAAGEVAWGVDDDGVRGVGGLVESVSSCLGAE